ncbi:MAG: hypothetical protein BRD33_00220 [Bacteroidetes bacterium QH_6_63_17]|nr:MAG: hypothetical protein BRD33_00220 [Bacteroidetes bacterium QH_6_63_17]
MPGHRSGWVICVHATAQVVPDRDGARGAGVVVEARGVANGGRLGHPFAVVHHALDRVVEPPRRVAITLGGIVSLSVLVVGAAMADAFTFQALADQLTRQLGDAAAYLLGLGLYAAGFSSATTASMAAAITAKGLAEDGAEDPAWQENGTKYRAV